MLHFLSPSHKKEQWVGHFSLCSLNFSALFWAFTVDFQTTSRAAAAASASLPDRELQHTSVSPSCWPVGGATWQHIRRRGGRRTAGMTHTVVQTAYSIQSRRCQRTLETNIIILWSGRPLSSQHRFHFSVRFLLVHKLNFSCGGGVRRRLTHNMQPWSYACLSLAWFYM